jgi:4-aminobutyrate aminotransferase-like enzyme
VSSACAWLTPPLLGTKIMPAGTAAAAIQRAALERGLIFELGGRQDAVIRLLPPLNVSRETLDQALHILTTVIAERSRADRSPPSRTRVAFQEARGRGLTF